MVYHYAARKSQQRSLKKVVTEKIQCNTEIVGLLGLTESTCTGFASELRHEVLKRGSTLYKYNYSNSKRARRHFWLSDNLQSLIWGKSRDDYSGEVDLRDVIGIVYGTLTTTFKDAKREAAKRNDVMPDKPWNCFSLLQAERTVDLSCIGDAQTEFWFMGLQRCIFQCRTDMTVFSTMNARRSCV